MTLCMEIDTRGFGMKKKIIALVAAPLSFIVIVIAAVFLILGAAFSLVDSVKNWWNSIGMVDEEELTDENLNDPEFMYKAVCDNKENMTALNLLMMDYYTTYTIFNDIHEYDDYRKKPKEIKYAYRIADADEAANEINEYTGEYTGDVTAASVKEEKQISLTPSDIELATDDLGSGILAMRWQPIYAACAVVGMDNYDNYGSVDDMDLENTNFEGYYVDTKDIDKICELFQMHIDFKYDATKKSKYSFKYFTTKKAGYKLKIYNTSDGGRVTERIPANAPDSVHNGFITYSYQYSATGLENTEICSSRYMVVTTSQFMSTMKEIDPKFDMERFLAILEILPSTDDLVEFYSRPEWSSNAVFDELLEPDTKDYFGNLIYSSKCPSIGVIYHQKKKSSGTSVDVEWGDGDTFGVPIYEFDASGGVNPLTGKSCKARMLYVDKEPNCEYELYPIYKYALRPFNESDGLNHDQLLDIIEDSTDYYVNSGNSLFDSENIDDTVDTLLRFQDECGCSPIALLAIMRAEGAVSGSYGKKYYNYFNIKARDGQPVIPGSDNFRDYKAQGFSMQDALYTQIYQTVYENYINKGQVNFFLFCWNNYDGLGYSSLSHCYCPVWDDPSMGWAEGSWWTGRTLSTDKSGGWSNVNAKLMYQMELWGETNLTDWNHEPFDVDSSDDSIWPWS